jgi:hypothetical protein
MSCAACPPETNRGCDLDSCCISSHMKEIVCSHCGAVSVSAADVSVCPHCGSNPRSPLGKIGNFANQNVGIVLWIVSLVLWRRPGRNVWDEYATIALTLFLGWAWSTFSRESKRGLHEPITALNLPKNGAPRVSPEIPSTRPQPPRIPGELEPLISLPRPREVFWPFWAMVEQLAGVVMVIGSLGFLVFMVKRHPEEFPDWRSLHSTNLPFLIATALSALFIVRGLYREYANRQLLRDGEATVAVIMDWISRSHGPTTVVYRFWTRTGECIEHRGTVVSERKAYSEKGLVPVFYLPEDPSKSLALCCTTLRPRIPSQEIATRMQRARVKS